MAMAQWAAGQRITAGRLAQMTPVWASWTPVWSTSTGLHLPSLGNATLSCEYAQAGNLVTASFDIGFGSSTTFGSGATSSDNWTFSLPPVACGNASGDTLGFMTLRVSDSTQLIGRVVYNGGNAFRLSIDSGRVDAVAVTATGVADSVSPWTWTTSSALHGTFQYQAA